MQSSKAKCNNSRRKDGTYSCDDSNKKGIRKKDTKRIATESFPTIDIIFKQLGWVNTILPLTVPYFFGQAFFIFQNMQFIRGIPAELDEAARIDGCTYYGIFLRIILPLIKPSIVTTAIFSFMWRWDDFFGALLYLNSPAKYTLSIALKMFSDPSSQSDWGSMFAMSTLSIIPIFLIFLFFQKYLVEGISTEGLKG